MSILDENLEVPFETLLETAGFEKINPHSTYTPDILLNTPSYLVDIERGTWPYVDIQGDLYLYKYNGQDTHMSFIVKYIPEGTKVLDWNKKWKTIRKPLVVTYGRITYKGLSSIRYCREPRYWRIDKWEILELIKKLTANELEPDTYKSPKRL